LLQPKTPATAATPTPPVPPFPSAIPPATPATPAKTLQVGVEYFRNHRDHLHYQRNARQGAPVGSGSVESLCSQLQNRFKRTGQFWSPNGLRQLLKLDVLNRNHNLQCLWN